MIYGIWCKSDPDDSQSGDWLRELPSKVDDGGRAILAYESRDAAAARAAKHFGFRIYDAAEAAGWCEVRPLA